MKYLRKYNEARLGTGISIFQYVSAHEFSEWVSFKFVVDSGSVYDKLLDDDYIEGSLGSRWSLDDYITKEVENGNEIAKWYLEFLKEFNLEEIQLKYGS